MLYWSLVFLAIALIAALFGFGGIAASAAFVSKILFITFLVAFAVTFIVGLARRS